MPEHQKCRTGPKRNKDSRTQERVCRKKMQQQEEMRKIAEKNARNEQRFRFLSDTVDKNKMADAEMVAELQGLQAGEERRGSSAPQTGTAEVVWQQFMGFGADQIAFAQRIPERMGAAQGQVPRREEGRRTVMMNKRKQDKSAVGPPAQGGSLEGAPASSLELDLHRVRGSLGEGSGASKSGAPGDRKRGPSRSPGRHSMMRKGMMLREIVALH